MPQPVLTREGLKAHVDAGRVVVGEHSYGVPALRYWGAPGGYVCRIGDFCSIADNVQIFLGGYHRPEWVTTYPFPAFEKWPEVRHRREHTVGRGDVVIGSDVWIGSQCVIMSGITIGHGAVLGARAVVSRDVPPYAVVAGNPAQVVKHRFPEPVVDELLRIAWWNWPESRIRSHLEQLLSGDIDGFIARNSAQTPDC